MLTEIMQVDADWLVNTLRPVAVMTVFFIFLKAIRPPSELIVDEPLISFFKFIGYGTLATIIFLTIRNNGTAQIDILTYFTFLLALIEAAHNFINSVGLSIAAGLRSLWDKVFKIDIV